MRILLALIVSLSLSACYSAPKDKYRVTQSTAIEHVVPYGAITFSRLADDVWMHSSRIDLPGIGPIVSNGMLVIDGERSVLIDTAWTDDQTAQILRFADEVLGKPVYRAVITHAHQDKIGGIAALHAAGVETWAHPLTNQLAPENGFEPARHTFTFADDGWALRGADAFVGLAIYFPGGGHTRDNIAVGLPARGIAFGGCLIKGSDASTLGNLTDADVANYANAARRFGQAYPTATTIVMSHSAPEGRAAIARTIELAEEI